MNYTNIIEIKPENVKPKGFLKFIYYFAIAFGLVSFIFGGFIFFFIGIWALFIQPKNVQKNYQVSYILTPENLTAYRSGRRIAWSIPWQDIQSIYYVKHNWAMPKSLALKLNNYQNFHESIEENKNNGKNSLIDKFSILSFHKNLLKLSKFMGQPEIVINYTGIDRSAEEFAQLLFLYMENASY